MKPFIRDHALYFAWLIALIGFFCSVFFGEMLHNEPCRLCWYQRICLFPLVILLGIAAYKDDFRITLYSLPFCILGGLLALYQMLGIFWPSLSSHALCGAQTDCSEQIFELWGFLSFPFMSFLGFSLIFFFLWIARRCPKL